ncbi:MAG: hypothetical protein SGJ09_13685 [Phycisphaerae bacterium]|nr:hypothetical protein [Phycisphaerae bacterium]
MDIMDTNYWCRVSREQDEAALYYGTAVLRYHARTFGVFCSEADRAEPLDYHVSVLRAESRDAYFARQELRECAVGRFVNANRSRHFSGALRSRCDHSIDQAAVRVDERRD